MSDESESADELTLAIRRASRLGPPESVSEAELALALGDATAPDATARDATAPDAAEPAEDATRIARRPPPLLSARPDDATAVSRLRIAPTTHPEATDPSARARRELGLPAVAPLLADPRGASVPVIAPVYGIRHPAADASDAPELPDPAELPAVPVPPSPGSGTASVPSPARGRRPSTRGLLVGVAIATVLVMAAALAGVVVLLAL
ncbi:hypothetical protein ABCS02_20540 [Microbacterium sp. X-17]|uniref:hypothetical protein n=1 Tax=Microbacterium sp. X-17 TaxID=3144404 RepID=UPI0031F4CA59